MRWGDPIHRARAESRIGDRPLEDKGGTGPRDKWGTGPNAVRESGTGSVQSGRGSKEHD